MLPSLLCILALHLGYARATQYLQLDAIVSSSGRASLECWEMEAPFHEYPTVGRVITGLANVANVSYVVLPPNSNEGIHKPPHPMFFVLLSGKAHITLPQGDDELWITAGLDGLIVANDMVGEGHITEYPSDGPSVALQIPFQDGVVPYHRVLHHGPCMKANRASNTKLDSQMEL